VRYAKGEEIRRLRRLGSLRSILLKSLSKNSLFPLKLGKCHICVIKERRSVDPTKTLGLIAGKQCPLVVSILSVAQDQA